MPRAKKHKYTPGPRGESCITCRERKKKCDKKRPLCQRCVSSKGRFICSGYGDESGPEVEEQPKEKEKEETRAALAKVLPVPPMRVGVEFEDAVPGSHTRSAYLGTPISVSELNDYLTPSTDFLVVPDPPESSVLTAGPLADHSPDAGWTPVTPEYNNAITLTPSVSVPRGVNANAQMRQSYLVSLFGEYTKHRVSKFFRPLTASMQGSLTAKMKRSHRILEFLYLGAKIFETFNGKSEKEAIKSCSQWVTRYSNHVSSANSALNPYSTLQDAEDRLNGLVEIVFLKFIVLGTSAGYASLRLALPNFLRLVSDDPRLCVEQGRSGLLCVSLLSALTTGRVEIRRFVFYDIMCSLVLGVPTLAEYDSTGSQIATDEVPFEWVHGVPVEMIVNITEVHKWRAQLNNVDWRVLETRTLEWSWSGRDVQFEESVQMIYRVAILESWRHATLIYIYMGMCGATSHDPRVQASVQQVIKLMGVVNDTHIDAHFSIPSVIVGVAARYEYQRALIFQKLKSFNGIRLCTVRGRDFARVLQHLWRGTAVNGAAVGWEDYMHARCHVLPI
ncbi:hypothetical protein B0J17DRAFT_683753 [Rhizoctonia solani]|nr:hypothetical protein B0J17DRAFT_683753 [Rhizoctonia solani]